MTDDGVASLCREIRAAATWIGFMIAIATAAMLVAIRIAAGEAA